MTLGAIGDPSVTPYLVAMLAENDDRDRWLRHAGVVALARIGDRPTVEELIVSPSPALRRVAVLTLRRWADSNLERLLFDEDISIRTEAARAVHDLPVPDAMPALASLAADYRPTRSSTPSSNLKVRREIRRSAENRSEQDLMSLAEFDEQPDMVEEINTFEGIDDGGSNYLTLLESRMPIPETGSYRFSISSDDSSVLRIAEDGNPDSLREIARVDGWVGPNQWRQQSSQQSEPIALEAGQIVLLEARHAQGGGGNHLAVGWTMPDGTFEGPIGGGGSELDPMETPLLRRIIDANLRLGEASNLEAIAGIAMNPDLPPVIRDEAMAAMTTFESPGPRDRVLGWWRPVENAPRDPAVLKPIYARTLPAMSEDARGSIRTASRELAGRVGVGLDPTALFDTVMNAAELPADRVACLRQLGRSDDERINEAIAISLASDAPTLRAEARDQATVRDPAEGLALYLETMSTGTRYERQRAVMGLSKLDDARASQRIRGLAVGMLGSGGSSSPIAVEIHEASLRSTDPETAAIGRAWTDRATESAAEWSIALEGGDPEAGALVARYHAGAQCLRCHVIEGRGGDAGPKLDGIAARSDPATILQSVIDPQAVLVEGYGSASAMPNLRQVLTPREVRDLVAYLSTLSEVDESSSH
jgi:mono/diheme cytochrome c family protein/HEAT repeat protein